MTLNLGAVLANMNRDLHFVDITRNPLAQFGTTARSYVGATLMPEVTKPVNAFREDAIKYVTVVANDGTRYSPVQKKGKQLVGSMLVEFGESDIGSDFTASEYDTLIEFLQRGDSMAAMTQLLNWSDVVLNRALVEHNERQIWQALVSAVVQRRGDNGYEEDVLYSNPSGHRFNAGGAWSDDTYDPFDDLDAAVDLLASKGYTANRLITSRPIVSIMQRNEKVQARVGIPIVNQAGTITVAKQRATVDAINGALGANGLPVIEEYNLQFRTQTGTDYFLPRNVVVLCATTGRDMEIDLGDNERMLVQNNLGYMGIGRPAGQASPGRVLLVKQYEDKPPRIEGQAWQTGLPVITEPEAIVVIGGIS